MNPDTLRQIVAEMRLADRYIPLTYWADRIDAEIAKVPEPVAWLANDGTIWFGERLASDYCENKAGRSYKPVYTEAPPAPAAVPDARPIESWMSDKTAYENHGWNACRAAMLDAAPNAKLSGVPEEGKP